MWCISRVWPSGRAWATRAAAMVPPAPVTFSTTTGWPRSRDMPSAAMRVITSVGPPAEKGTMIVTGLFGIDEALDVTTALLFKLGMDRLPDLSSLSRDEKGALIHALWAQVQALTARVAELEAKFGLPPKTPDNSSLPPSQGQKPNRDDKPARTGPRQGSLGREGGGRLLAEAPDETVTARPARCAHCQAALNEADQTLAGRFDKVDLPTVAPVVTRVERYAGHCRCCGGTTPAPPPPGVGPRTPV